MSPREWPWRRWGLWAAILVVGGVAGWLLAICNNSSSFYPPTTTAEVFPDQTATVTIPTNVLYPGTGQTPDNADKVPPDQPGVVPVVIPGAAFEKLAPARELWIHQPSPSVVSTWGPTIATLIVGSLATTGVIITWQQKNRSDRRSEWWKRTSWAFERTLSDSGDQVDLGWNMLLKLVRSTLATKDDVDIVQVITEHAALVSIGEVAPYASEGSPEGGGEPASA